MRLLLLFLALTVLGCSSASVERSTVERALKEPTTHSATTPPPRTVLANIDEAYALLDHRPEWTPNDELSIPHHPAEKFLKGMTIVLDPGHGMSDHETDPGYKRGVTGLREDDMNLRVGLLLRKLLVDAGVNVILTRDADAYVSLKDRAEIANNANDGKGADLFISLHHNTGDGPSANYTTVWYHGEVDWNGIELDVGRYIAHALGRHLRTDVTKTSPLMSDQLMYTNGFGVLRQTKVPALLCEISFYSNPAEEQRLADAKYNLREAYAIYEGLCEWAYCGRPTQTASLKTRDMPSFIIQADGAPPSNEPLPPPLKVKWIECHLNDGLPGWWGKERNRIDTSSIQVFYKGRIVGDRYDQATQTLTLGVTENPNASWQPIGAPPPPVVVLAAIPIGGRFEIHFRNMLGNSNYPTRYELRADGTITPLPPVRAGTDDARSTTRESATTPPTTLPTGQSVK